MDFYDILKIGCFYVLVASTEMLNGVVRALYFNKRLGAKAAKNVFILPALLWCLGISYFYVPTLSISSSGGLFALGVSLSAFMLAFDVLLGKFVMKLRLSTILKDLDLREGRLLGLGLLAMSFCPWLAEMLRRSGWLTSWN